MAIKQNKNRKTKIIAEIGGNHRGKFDTAIKMIDVASQYCDIIKFQKRHVKSNLSNKEYNKPHPNPFNSYGHTYGEHRDFLEFSIKEHLEFKKRCEKKNRIYSCSVWDLISAKEIIKLNLSIIKIPSACNLNKELLEYVFKNHKNEIHISLGMTTNEQTEKIFKFSQKYKKNKDLVLYACTSSYPANTKDLYLKQICYLDNKYSKKIKSIGFSGHHTTIIPDVAAIAFGVKYIERHFTLNKSWKGTDHSASLESDQFRILMRNLISIEEANKTKPDKILDVEKSDFKKLKKVRTL